MKKKKPQTKEDKQKKINEITKALMTDVLQHYNQWRKPIASHFIARRYNRVIGGLGFSYRAFVQTLDGRGYIGLLNDPHGKQYLMPRNVYDGLSIFQRQELAHQLGTPKPEVTNARPELPDDITVANGRQQTDDVFNE